jgi:hypothetical protein
MNQDATAYIIDDVGDEFTEVCIERRQEENNSKR